jgi:hypothetical protein
MALEPWLIMLLVSCNDRSGSVQHPRDYSQSGTSAQPSVRSAATAVRPSAAPVVFDCGKILLGLKSTATSEDVSRLLRMINGEMAVDMTKKYGWASVRVQQGTERDAIVRLFADPMVRYAELSTSAGTTGGGGRQE